MDATLVRFARFLQREGLTVTPAQLTVGLQAAALVGVERPQELGLALRAAFTHRREDFSAFPELFRRFFLEGEAEPTPSQAPAPSPAAPSLGLAAEDHPQPAPDQSLTPASEQEVLGRTAFRHLDSHQAQAVLQEVERLLQPLARRLSRRRRPGGRRELAWRASLRRSLASGGEMLALRFRRRKRRELRLVVLADVSGSMELVAPYVLRFLAGLAAARRQIEVFVFATRLTRITPWLAPGQVEDFLRHLPHRVPDLAGGTRLGACLAQMLRTYGRLITPHTVALIFSDGWDRGDPTLLARQMARLRRQCRRLIWLNPLLESPRYQPLNRGMRAALPFVDHLIGCHDLQSLQKAARLLERLTR